MNQKNTVIKNLLRTTKRTVKVKRTKEDILAFWSQLGLTESSESRYHLSGFSRADKQNKRVAKSKTNERRVKNRLALLITNI